MKKYFFLFLLPFLSHAAQLTYTTAQVQGILDKANAFDTNIVATVNSNSLKIATNTAQIATNTAQIATNTAQIATNTAQIATNTAQIATNTAQIAFLTNCMSRYNTNATLILTNFVPTALGQTLSGVTNGAFYMYAATNLTTNGWSKIK